MQLVLSLFPGIGLLDMAFEAEGFCVVQSRDWIMGGDIRKAHFPSGRFDGVIGGPPCQMFSSLAHMVRHNGYEPKFGNLIPDFCRVVAETESSWFLMEEVIRAPRPRVDGYGVWDGVLNNRQCIDEDGKAAKQNRVRAISFGMRGQRKPLMIDVALWQNEEFEHAACGGTHGEGGISRESSNFDPAYTARAMARKKGVPVAIGGSGKPKPEVRQATTRLNDCVGSNVKSKSSFRRLCELQGLPPDFDIEAFTVSAKCKAVGNGVPMPMGRAIAKAVSEATQQQAQSKE